MVRLIDRSPLFSQKNRTYNTIYINKFLPPPGFELRSLGTISRWLIHYASVPHLYIYFTFPTSPVFDFLSIFNRLWVRGAPKSWSKYTTLLSLDRYKTLPWELTILLGYHFKDIVLINIHVLDSHIKKSNRCVIN